MSSFPTQGAVPAADLASEIAQLLARPPQVDGVKLDTAYFTAVPTSSVSGPEQQSVTQRILLDDGYRWQQEHSDAMPAVPLQLCEFLAYKAALAYETEARIKNYLDRCCHGVTRFRFFDSASDAKDTFGVLADAQGYGFVFERKAFVIFRGTKSSNDWKINSIDALTDSLNERTDRRTKRLRAEYGNLLDKLGDPKPGRHVGFSIAWAALKHPVEDWLSDALEQGAIDKIIYSGHSLGGAMAQVAAFDHARIETGYEPDRNIQPQRVGAVVTFGAPAVGGSEFAKAFTTLLGDRTVLLESSGDLVPRIMNRWYYRMLYPLRQRVKAGVQAHLVASEGFTKPARQWTFASEPPLSDQDIDDALASIRAAAQTALRDMAAEQDQRRKTEAEEQFQRARDNAKAKVVGGNTAGDAAKHSTANATGSTMKPAGSSSGNEATPPWVYWVVIGVAALAVTGVAWYFVRRKLFSHDIEQRYALYLSTLSYQQLRAKHAGNLDAAHSELGDHLRFVRGDLPLSHDIAKTHPASDGKHSPFFESVQSLPVPIKVREDKAFVEYLKHSQTFV